MPDHGKKARLAFLLAGGLLGTLVVITVLALRGGVRTRAAAEASPAPSSDEQMLSVPQPPAQQGDPGSGEANFFERSFPGKPRTDNDRRFVPVKPFTNIKSH
jgi:hypothetical protein